jgi:SAM-dependent methyltransferase
MPESFDAHWLRLRADTDAAARAVGPYRALAAWAEGVTKPLRCIDLGCGLGTNAAWLAPRLPGPQQWLLVDHDPALLAEAERRVLIDADGERVATKTRRADLNEDLTTLTRDSHLVTAAALLDLVSRDWIDHLVAVCQASGAAALFALSYDGHFNSETPGDPDERRVREAFNRDQRRDKGFGPALGPDAALYAARAFRTAGYRIHLGRSPWRLGPQQAALQQALIDGKAAAARSAAPEQQPAIDRWARNRHRAIATDTARLRVGHLDLFAAPGERHR